MCEKEVMVIFRAAKSEDWPQITRLLGMHGLPLAGAREHLDAFLVAESDGAVIGCIGAEYYGEAALMRSLAVTPDARGQGVGSGLVVRLLAGLRQRNVRSAAIVTTTADGFFTRFGFVPVAREEIPAALLVSQEFNGACPASAKAMLLRL